MLGLTSQPTDLGVMRISKKSKLYFLTKLSLQGKIAIIVCTNDIIIKGDFEEEIRQLKNIIKNYEIKILENLRYFLGIQVSQPKRGILASQRKYNCDLL